MVSCIDRVFNAMCAGIANASKSRSFTFLPSKTKEIVDTKPTIKSGPDIRKYTDANTAKIKLQVVPVLSRIHFDFCRSVSIYPPPTNRNDVIDPTSTVLFPIIDWFK